jgi:hypothetical protein
MRAICVWLFSQRFLNSPSIIITKHLHLFPIASHVNMPQNAHFSQIIIEYSDKEAKIKQEIGKYAFRLIIAILNIETI